MPKKVPPKLDWEVGGWVGEHRFDDDTLSELKAEACDLPVKQLELITAEYIMFRNQEMEMPTLMERKANLNLLSQTEEKLSMLIGRSGIDKISIDYITARLALGGYPRVLTDLRKNLLVLRQAVKQEIAVLATEPKGRPRKIQQRVLARNLFYVFESVGHQPKTTKNGPFVRVLEILLKSAGDPKEDAQSIARIVIPTPRRLKEQKAEQN